MMKFDASISGFRLSDDMLSLLALRYGSSSGAVTLESFISLALRMDCMTSEFIHSLSAPLTERKRDRRK